MKRITIFVLHDEDSTDYDWVSAWIIKWRTEFQLRIVDYSTGGWEHLWNVEASEEAINEVPESYLCGSKWSNPDLFENK